MESSNPPNWVILHVRQQQPPDFFMMIYRYKPLSHIDSVVFTAITQNIYKYMFF